MKKHTIETLRQALYVIQEDHDTLVDSNSLIGHSGPIRGTLDEDVRPEVKRLSRLIRRIKKELA